MPSNTPNLGLRKINQATDGNLNVNVETDFNDNWDKIDQSVATKDELNNINFPVKSVNSKTGTVTLTASDVGAETPSEAQAKANSAETNAINFAKGYGIGTNSKKFTDADTVTDGGGLYYCDTNVVNTPVLTHGYLIAGTNGGGGAFQYFITQSDSKLYKRTKHLNAWGTWGEVETVSGAQSKANTAETNAIDFAKGFGLGSQAKNETATTGGTGDWDLVTTTGFYRGANMMNRPPYTSSHTWDYCIVLTHLTSYAIQIMTDFSNNETWQRILLNGTWQPWKRMVDDTVLQNAIGNANGWKVISNQTLAAQTASINLSNIDSKYDFLKLYISKPSGNSVNASIQFNSVATTVYDTRWILSDNNGVVGGASIDGTSIHADYVGWAGATSEIFIDNRDANNVNGTIKSVHSQLLFDGGFTFDQNSKVSSITINQGEFPIGTKVTLLGGKFS